MIIDSFTFCFSKYFRKHRFPKPSFPPPRVFGMLIGDSVAIAIVSFALNVSMAKLFAKKHKYEIKANQVVFLYSIITRRNR